jgi:hypothetical protein
LEAVAVDPLEVIALMWNIEQEDTWVARVIAPLPHLELVYEQDLIDAPSQHATVRRLASHLHFAHGAFPPRLARGSNGWSDLDRHISNLDEVRTAVAGTRYNRFLSADH